MSEEILQECMGFLEQHLDKPVAKLSMARFYAGTKSSGDLVSVLLSAAQEHLSPTYGTKVLNFFNRLFQLGGYSMQYIRGFGWR